MMHIKEPLLLFGNSNPCGGSGFPLAICVVLYHISDANCKQNMLNASLNKIVPSSLPFRVKNISDANITINKGQFTAS